MTLSIPLNRQLLTAGADPDRKATRGQTALIWAAGQGRSGVIEALLEFGADPRSRSDIRKQFMKTDKAQKSAPSYQVWVEQGGNTALMFAARSYKRDTTSRTNHDMTTLPAPDGWRKPASIQK